MNKTVKRIFAVSLVVVLSACGTGELKTVRDMSVSGSAFDIALHKEYVDRATNEFSEVDWKNGRFFTAKARSVVESGGVLPQVVAERELPEDTVGEITVARARLIKGLDASGRTKVPDDAAHAQLMFDCWLEEQEEDIQPDDIAACRGEFELAMDRIEAALVPPPAPAPAPAPAPKPVAAPPPPPPPLPGPYIVHFDFDSAELTTAAMGVIREVIVGAVNAKPSAIQLSGHTDLSGNPDYNMDLSKARVDAVSGALIAAGISPSLIGKSIHGEERPQVKTPDGKRESANRRVEVNFER